MMMRKTGGGQNKTKIYYCDIQEESGKFCVERK